jgi:cytoskeleton protein RodZ
MMNDSDGDVEQKNTDFGSVLAEARKAQNYTLEDIYEHLKIPLHVLREIEANDLDALPSPAYTQGYIRAYAKFLEISEENVLQLYNLSAPHKTVSSLKRRSYLPDQASSQSPLVKIITAVLVLAGIAVAIVGSYQYYQKKAGVMESKLESRPQRFTGNSLDSPGEQSIDIKKNARLTDEDELIVEKSEPSESKPIERVTNTADQTETAVIIEEVDSSTAVNGNDIIEIHAEKGSWMEVRDASESRLLYNTVPVGGTKVLVGHAPFSISMGNARSTRVLINDLEIDVSEYIRTNNTVSFKVSTQGQNVVFH